MYYSSHLNTAKELLLAYKPEVAFNAYLKAYFRQNKKHGSKDRKLISALCYSYFRLGFSFENIAIEERILIGFFLCHHSHSEFLDFFKPEWDKIIGKPYEEKFAHLNGKDETNIFPFANELSNKIDHKKFSFSFLKQPKLFLRIRPGYENIVPAKLQAANVDHVMISSTCISLANSLKINAVIELDKEAVVQDYNSQRIGEIMELAIGNNQSSIDVWDCCAASGGKSIMACDINPAIKLTVSDKRESILKNLRKRFTTAAIKNYSSFVADLSIKTSLPITQKFDLIIADVPCTGSGTWGRTPEQLFYFNKKQIKKYSDLQKKIIENAMLYLKPQGWFLYITCSVFKEENESVVNFITNEFKLDLVKMEVLKGYEIGADTMFAGLLRSS